jgi:hypothetical protein
MGVANDYDIHSRYVFDYAGDFGVSFWSHEAGWRTAVLEDRIEQDS